jgi:hypothetical protein
MLSPGRASLNGTGLEDVQPVSAADVMAYLLVERSLHTFRISEVICVVSADKEKMSCHQNKASWRNSQ